MNTSGVATGAPLPALAKLCLKLVGFASKASWPIVTKIVVTPAE